MREAENKGPLSLYNEVLAPAHNTSVKLVDQLSHGTYPDTDMYQRVSYILGLSDPHDKLFACEILHEMAMKTDNEELAYDWETQAQEGWEWIASTYSFKEKYLPTEVSLKAQKQLAYSSLYLLGIVAPDKPTYEARELTYNNLADVAISAREGARYAEVRQINPRSIGEMAELSVLLLLQRHGLKFDDDNYWWPYPSLASEGLKQKDRSNNLNHNWDINIMTRFGLDQPLDTAYKIEVKHTDVNKRDKRFRYEDAVVVKLKEIVRSFKLRNEIAGLAIPRVVAMELEGYGQATDILNKATDLLLDKIDKN